MELAVVETVVAICTDWVVAADSLHSHTVHNQIQEYSAPAPVSAIVEVVLATEDLHHIDQVSPVVPAAGVGILAGRTVHILHRPDCVGSETLWCVIVVRRSASSIMGR